MPFPAAVPDCTYGTPHFVYSTVGSTNDLAKLWALAGAPPGTLITASHQTDGRGRRGRDWADIPSESAIMTFIARPPLPLVEVWKVPFAASYAVMLAIRSLGAPVQLKWPNDVVAGGRKLAGILVETVAGASSERNALIGIGVNVAQTGFEGGDSFLFTPTSLRLELGSSAPSVNITVSAVADALTETMPRLATASLWESLAADWGAEMLTGIEQSGITATGEPISGVIHGMRAADGSALLDTSQDIVHAWPR